MSFPPDEPMPPFEGPDAPMTPGEDEGMLPEEEGMDPLADPMQEEDDDYEPEPLLPARPAKAVDYTVKMSKERREELGRYLIDEYEAFRTSTEDRRSNLAVQWRADANLERSTQPQPWRNASQMRGPFLAMACQNHTSRLNGHIGSGDPPWAAVPEDSDAAEHAAKMERAVKNALEKGRFEKFKRLVNRDLPIVVPCAMKVEWRTITRRAPDIGVEQDQKAAMELAMAGVRPDRAYTAAVERGPDGLAKMELYHKDVVIFDGPAFDVVPFERLVMLPITAPDRDRLWGIGERLLIRGDELLEGVDEGRYLEEPVNELLELDGEEPDEDEYDSAAESGLELSPGGPRRESRYRAYECLMLDYYGDLNDDRKMEWYLLLVHIPTARVLQVQYNPDQHGMSRYELFGYMDQSGKLMSMSLCEKMQYLQDACTAAVNSAQNLVDKLVGSAGNFFYDPRAKRIRPEQWEVDPNAPIEVDDINGIMLNPMAEGVAQVLPAVWMAIDRFKEWYELLTATNNTALGRETDVKRTAFEVKQVQNTTAGIFEDYAAGVAESYERVIERVAALLSQYSENGKYEFRHTNEQGDVAFDTVTSLQLQSRVTWTCTGLSQLPDYQSRSQRDMMVMQVLGGHPLTMNDWPTQVKVLKEFLQDVQFPGWEKLVNLITIRAKMLMMDEMAMQAGAAAGAQAEGDAAALEQEKGQQELQKGEAEMQAGQAGERRAEEQHQVAQAGAVMGIAQQDKELKAPVNGKKGK